ncbi:glycoside hydrolase family 35 protein [Coprobacillus cateniformis]|uniref:glycoside hydrolase family 35 protein n=1 Tax=Coprobacillus cateniformis TaxID=100884 RepID=UPI0024A970AD|nr:beta-galactosidase family protein [Coprobacillus cateniformis]
MKTFEIKDEFIVDGKPIKILSGAIHYFRIVPKHWEDSLYNLKALGFNTVETYIPWNLHEPKEGEFDFQGIKDVVSFIKKAQEMELMVIVRPSPYICAEWEFGGLPAWLLTYDNLHLRSDCPRYLEKVKNYYEVLLPMLTSLQSTQGGPIIMMQVENEFGSFSNNKTYLKKLKKIMLDLGVEVPLFTSDGSWQQALESGSLIDDDVLVTANFGSHSHENLDVLEQFMANHQKKWPLMSMEFWDGWFNRWGEEIITRDAQDLANCVKELLTRGSINLYMFHGGTNFGFMNGCSARGQKDLPQVTSYDYDALLTEAGDITEKYQCVKKVMKELFPDIQQMEPRMREKKSYGTIPLNRKVSLFETLEDISECQRSVFPQTLEQLGEGYGYVLYKTQVKGFHQEEKVKVIEASDCIQVYKDGEHIITQNQEEIGKEFPVYFAESNELSILVENMGRVNYGYKLLSPTQKKGIRSGVMVDIHFETDWQQYPLPLNNIENINFDKGWQENTPSFYEFVFNVDECQDTFIDCHQLGKGCIFINGFHLGRYWSRGPIEYLYLPGPLLKKGMNQIIVFETEGVAMNNITFVDYPVYKKD